MYKLSILLYLLSSFFCCISAQISRTQDFNFDWKFSLSNDSNSFSIDYNDKNWEKIDLPHDWSVEASFDTLNGEGCSGYLPGGIGWYRKEFTLSPENNQKIYILFDGVYNHSEVWINGHRLGYHPYGYTPFYYDLTPYLYDEYKKNIIAVKVDHSRYADSRWYAGSGIYRNLKLITTDKLHIPIWGSFVTTPQVSESEAEIALAISLKNDYTTEESVLVRTKILNPSGKVVAESSSNHIISSQYEEIIKQGLKINQPQLWSTERPAMYQASITVWIDNKMVDSYTTLFGIRKFRFDPEKGFFLNDKNIKIKGVCLHHDAGLVGAAVPKGVWRRRLQALKDGGCNAIRISHNPASEELLDLCDEMGFLVQDEFFDEWDFPKDKRLNMYERHDDYISRGSAEYFQEYAEKDLKTTVLAHRNHPSVFQWSIGNEIEWTYPRNRPSTGFFDNMSWSGNYFWSQPPYSPQKIKSVYDSLPKLEYQIENTALKLAGWTKQMDTTRPVIANCILPSASFETGYADALDIVGFSYRRVMYDYAKKYYPNKVIMGTENVGQWHEWKAIEERPFISGTFLWTGIDYMGEAHHRKRKGKKEPVRRKGISCGVA